jgi:PKD repeat protein
MVAASFAAHATTIVLPTDEQLVAKSPVIVSGTVTAATPIDHDGAIWTETTVAVERVIKGSVSDTITVQEPGGLLGDRITKIFGAPKFTEGERVLLFLESSPRGGYRVVDLFVGKFAEGKTLDGRRLWMRHDGNAEAQLLDSELHPIHARNIQRDAAGFETFVRERIAGRAGSKSYGIENPVLELDASTGRVKSDFTLISEPAVYRWWFTSGSKAWYTSGAQSGYANGGVSETQTAMNVWTGYSEAKIAYSYAGALPVAPKGMTARNNYNEVVFNDPLNEISGSWNKSTGGVVGQGGFNGTAAGGTFTATFQADASHPAGTIQAYEITEGNLTIQDNVSPANGISSSTLAEIIAHELGHTLGFGHSASTTALMYYSVTGLGASLRDDDMVAARWLYPNGSGGGPVEQVPAAPSNLSATPTSNYADLTWKDNATNESSESVYLAVGSGTFSKVADLGANVTSVRITGLASGTYRAYVIATNGAGNSPQSNIATFTIASAPSAGFSFTPQSGNAGATFTFYDESQGNITSRAWTFGDGGIASGTIAQHAFATSGIYPVTLVVSGPGGTSSVTHNVTVSGALSSQFMWTPANPTTNDTIQFTDLSGGGPASWQWSFGDGTSSTEQNPTKKYAAQGNYNVTLLVGRNGATATSTKSITVSGTTPGTTPVVAAFDLSNAAPEIGTNVTFNDRSTGSPTQWSWSFGDGATSNAQNPSHTYASTGTYTVTLIASKASSQSSLSKSITVLARAPYRTLISAAAQTDGLGGTSWRTELSLFNAGLEGANVTMRFLPSLAEQTFYLAPRQSVTYANTLLEVFGLTSGAGAVTIDAESAGSSAQLRVTSRTFTAGAKGTYGQSVPEVQSAGLGRTLYIAGIAANAAYRTNLGFVNRAVAPVSATLTLYAKSGDTIATKNVSLAASSFQQSALWAYFPEVSGGSYDGLTLKIAASVADAVSAYASIVDNATQDPIYLQAVAAPTAGALTIPAVGRAPGANQTFWRSDVTLFNPNDDAMTLTLHYGATDHTLVVGAHDTAVIQDILASYGLTSGSGALRVTWNEATGPVVTSRTYTSVESGGTYGQSIDPIASLGAKLFVPGLRNDTSFRSNIGFVNGGSESETFNVIVLSQFGTELGRTIVTLGADAQGQYSVSSLFPNVNASAFTLAVEGDANAQLFAYGSMVDNASGDPVFFAGQ